MNEYIKTYEGLKDEGTTFIIQTRPEHSSVVNYIRCKKLRDYLLTLGPFKFFSQHGDQSDLLTNHYWLINTNSWRIIGYTILDKMPKIKIFTVEEFMAIDPDNIPSYIEGDAMGFFSMKGDNK